MPDPKHGEVPVWTNALEQSRAQQDSRGAFDRGFDAVFSRIPGLRSILDLKAKKLNRDPRHLYHNVAIPEEELDPKKKQPKAVYTSNKVRTTKYTPLNFLPKNIINQFRNAANLFFLLIAILSGFSIFGVKNPGLAAVPIIAIVACTAIRDVIEDSRRQILDMEVNSTITAVLVNVENKNIRVKTVSPWRRFKKGWSHMFSRCWGCIRRKKTKANVDDLASLYSVDFMPRTSITTIDANFAPRHKLQPSDVSDMATPRPSTTFDLPNPNRPSLDAVRTRSRGQDGVAQDSRPSADGGRTIGRVSGSFFGRRSSETQNIKPPKFKRRFWKDVEVGNFVKIFDGEGVPADIVILATSDQYGECFIETRNLDGETTLKSRQALQLTKHWRHAANCADASFWMEVEGANSNLSSFGWTIHVGDEVEAMTPATFIPRGSTIRNTKWVIGYVVYTGEESKIVLNAGETPSKRSRLTRELNFYVFISFAILILLSFIAGIVEGTYFRRHHTSARYFEFGLVASHPSVNGFVDFWAYLILLQNIIPISLYISIEIVRTCQAFFIYSDIHMYDETQDYPCTPKTWSISDDLGQIEYIFSDKTGTLTQNLMMFRKCSVGGKSYGVAYTETMAGNAKRLGNAALDREKVLQQIEQEKKEMVVELQHYYDNPYVQPHETGFISAEIVRDLRGNAGQQKQDELCRFLLCMALCNTVVAELTSDGTPVLKAESPDETAIIDTAKELGYTLVKTGRRLKVVDICGVQRQFEVLTTIFFTSDRKRMSTLIRNTDGRIYLFTKGADNVMARLLSESSRESEVFRSTQLHLEEYANDGLRTLLFAYKQVSPEFANEWIKRWNGAVTSSDREQRMNDVAREIECDLTLLGATGVEDMLQVGVPDTIATLGEAGIKLWVLTGDKVETAISIGFSCNLLNTDMTLLVIKHAEQVSQFLADMGIEPTETEFAKAKQQREPPSGNYALIVDGDALDQIIGQPGYQREFALLGKKCRAVLCCRVNPAQKAAVAYIMRATFDVMTLAIGDGANDVSMIQVADIGVGVVGAEGRQAAMSADYAIGQFRFLERLLLVHGRWSYRRIAEMTANLLYKNYVFTMTLFWYGIWSSFDAVYLFDYTYITLYNSLFTSLPVVMLGLFDQDVPDRICLAVPKLYTSGIKRTLWTKKRFGIDLLDAFYQSCIAYFFAFCVYYNGRFASRTGRNLEYREAMGAIAATTTVFVVNLYTLMHQCRWDWLSLIVNVASSGMVFFWTGIYTIFTASRFFYKAGPELYATLSFWACFFVSVIGAVAPRFFYQSIRALWFPTDVDIIREQYFYGKMDISSLGQYSPTPSKETLENTRAMHTPTSSVLSSVSFPNSVNSVMTADSYLNHATH